jgi:hypothetical protein
MAMFCIVQCFDCLTACLFDIENEDPTSSSGCCKSCGSRNYNIFSTTIDEKQLFLHQLKTGQSMQDFQSHWFMRYKGEIIA